MSFGRRRSWLLVLLPVLFMLGATAAAGAWRTSTPVAGDIVMTGDFDARAQWVGAAPTFSGLFPGEAREATLRVSNVGSSDTLRWRLAVDVSAAGALGANLQFSAHAGACSGSVGTPLARPFHPATGGIAQGSSIDVCVRAVLPASTANMPSFQGATTTATVEVTVGQAHE